MKYEIHFTNNVFGFKYWDGILNTEDRERVLCVKLEDMQALGVAKTLNSTRKVENWLNSYEGKKWINSRLDSVVVNSFGAFL